MLLNTRENLEDSNRSIHNRRKKWFKMDSYIILCAIIVRVVYKYTLYPDSGWKSNIQPPDQRVGSLQTAPPRPLKVNSHMKANIDKCIANLFHTQKNIH